jgi:RHS repeat-associated protein
MTIAAKHFDPLVGLDIHIILIPSPAGPIPTPLPHPYVGMVFDPMDYAPFIGATTFINGLPRGQAGSSGLALPPHIPMGGPFAKPPSNESEIFMGSSVVLVEGEPQSFLGMPVLSCQDIGMPAPPRPKKKSVPKSLMLPTTVVLCIPMGMLVLIGGPPTISMMAIGMRLGFGALMKFRSGKLMKKFSDKVHALAEKAMKKLGLGDVARAKAHKAICSVTGHPVDIATGKVFTEKVDCELPGLIPFRWERTWYSTSTYRGPLGHGWHHSYDLSLDLGEPGLVLFHTDDGRHVALPPLRVGEEHFERREKLTLLRDEAGYSVRDRQDRLYRFAPVAGRPPHQHPLGEIQDRAGNTVRLHYDAGGRLSAIVDPSGRWIQIVSDAEGRTTALVAPHPTIPEQRIYLTRYTYDAWGNLASVVDAAGHTATFSYQGHLLVKETDRNGLSFHFAYDGGDATARCVHTWGDGGIYDHKLTYFDESTIVENSLGQRSTFFHREGTVHKSVDPLGNTTLTERNDFAEVVKETDALGQVKLYERDERGNVVSLTLPSGASVKAQYDARDRLVESEDAVGGKWHWTYDDAGRLLERRDPLGRATKYTWHGARPDSVTEPDGSRTAIAWDANGNLAQLLLPDGAQRTWDYDAHGRSLREVDFNGNVRKRERDLLGRTLRVLEPDGNVRQYAYDPEGNVTLIRERDQEATLSYTGMGRLAARNYGGATIRFEYDTEERLRTIVNEHGVAYRFVLGPAGWIDAESGFDGVTRRFTRDALGRVVRADGPAGSFTEYRYDPANRVIERKHADGSKDWFTYRDDGDLLEAGNAATVVKLERDAVGRVIREQQGDDWVAFEYDLLNRLTATRSSRGADIAIERNVRGHVTAVRAAGSVKANPATGAIDSADSSTAFEARFTRDSFGRELERVLPGGARSGFTRDSLGRPLVHEIGISGEQVGARRYEWGVDDRLVAILDAMEGPVRFGHGPWRNLERAEYREQAELRISDAVGNLFRTVARNDRQYGPAGELLRAVDARGTTAYRYDEHGNLIEKIEPQGARWVYEWDPLGMLTKVERPDGEIVRFAYDAFGRRIWKSFRGKVTRWLWQQNVPLHEWIEPDPAASAGGGDVQEAADDERAARTAALLVASPAQGPPHSETPLGTPDAPITWLFVPGTFAPLAKLVGERMFGIVTDHLGTPLRMYDADGQEVWAAEIGVFGELRNVRGDRFACPFRWPGQYEDAETGLYYNRFRYYSPEAGQYISQDPLRLFGGLAPYAYVHDPLVFRDPLGLFHESDPGHGVYVIADKATGEPIYVGTTNDMDRRMGEHIDSGKMDPDKHVFVPVVEDVTHGEARGAEQALMEDLGTKTKGKRGTAPNNVVDSVAAHRLDNPSDARERAFSAGYDKHKGVTVDDAKAKVAAACGG